MAQLTRKTVTVLFSDVVGSTPLGEGLDPESVRAMMSRYFDRMAAVIERHGGTVEKYIGDAVMAVFGIPRVHEDDALRAVRAATEMREALADLNRELDHPLSIRIGLNTGEVVAGEEHTLVTGDAVNVAARLEQAAEAGEILVGAATHDLVRDAVLAEPVEPLAVKGKTAAVEAYRVTAVLRDAPGRVRRFDADLVGREDELGLLRQAYARATGLRSCHLFTVLGPAGVGKSRLARELVSQLAGEATVLVGRCLPYGEGITFWPLRDVVHALGDLHALVGDADAAIVETAVGVGDMAAAPEETARAVRRVLEAVAADRPLVLVFEDIHWAEPAFLDVVDHVAESARDAPILLLCLARAELLEERPGWGGGKVNSTTILLEPLDAERSEQLVENLGGDVLEPAARQTITEVAEGNPLFLEEMVAMVVEDGATAAVPPSIHALLTARLERLPPAQREALAAAAVVGRFFSAGAVAALAGDGVVELLDTLERKDLIRPQPVSFAAAGGYRFRHILIRDAAYDALPKAVRAQMHERLADWLEVTTGLDVEELVGWHLERAHGLRRELGTADDALALRAYEALARVGRRALGRGDAGAAESLLDRALALPGPLDAGRVEARLELVTALLERGRLARAEETAELALAGAKELGTEALVARARVECAHVLFHTEPDRWERTATATANAAIGPLERAGDDVGLARAWFVVVVHDYVRGRSEDLQRALEPALRHARASGDRRHELDLLTLAARSVVFGPLPVDEALAYCDTVVAEGADEGVVHGVRACLHAMAGRFDAARSEYLAGQALLEEMGRTRLLAVQRAYAGTVELLADDPAAAERELRTAARDLEAIGDRGTLSTIAALLAAALHVQGRPEEALRWAEAARRDASTADLVSQVEWRTALARLEPARGVELAEEAVAVAEETEATTLQADALLCLRDALLAAGRAADAERAGRRARALYGAKGHVVGLQRLENPSLAAASASHSAGDAGGT